MRRNKTVLSPVNPSKSDEKLGISTRAYIPSPEKEDLDNEQPFRRNTRQERNIEPPMVATVDYPAKTKEAIEALDRALSTSSWSSDSF